MGGAGDDCYRHRGGREMGVVSICRGHGGIGGRQGSLMSQILGFGGFHFDVMVFPGSFFKVIISNGLSAEDDAMAELEKDASRRDDGDLSGSIGEWDDFLTD